LKRSSSAPTSFAAASSGMEKYDWRRKRVHEKE
jgi:hypothetical protein